MDNLTFLNNLLLYPDEYLKEENIEQPNKICIENTYQVINELAKRNILPEKLTPSAEEGICLKFENENENLYVEIYNTGELGYIIENRILKEIVENEDVSTIDDIINRINEFVVK